jgi:general secretion pathway protein F
MEFQVRALSQDNRMQTLAVEGVDATEVKRSLEARGMKTVSIEQRAGRTRGRVDGGFALLEFSQELVALLEAGLGIVEALEGLLEKEAAPRSRAIHERLLARLREGQRLSAALRAESGVFDTLFVGIVQAAEGTSDLPLALSRYIDYSVRMQGLRNRVLSASIYPAILLVVGAGIALFPGPRNCCSTGGNGSGVMQCSLPLRQPHWHGAPC